MAIKHFCDGCDEEIRNWSEGNRWAIDIRNNQDKPKILETFDLCQPCARSLISGANPKEWVRMAKPERAA